MKQDGFDLAIARAERAFSKLVRIREGIEEIEPDDALGVKRVQPGRASQVQRKGGQPQDRRIAFNRPATRSYRPTSATGATSFHIQHRAISKVTHEMNEGGLRNRPGAARAHSRYVEREWKAIMAEGDARYRQALADADERVARYRRTRRGPSPAGAEEQEAITLRDTLHRAARLDDIAFRLRHGIERARSRASHVRQANRQLVQAFDADPAAGRPSERDQSEWLVAESSAYLGLLNDRLAEERVLLADCRRDAEAMRDDALEIEYQRYPVIAAPVVAIAIEPTAVEPRRTVAPTKVHKQALAETSEPATTKEPSEAAKQAIAAALAAARAAGR